MTKDEQSDPKRSERKVAGLPFDLRRPTIDRFGQRAWNPRDMRLFTPKTFGWGYGINFYWLAHPGKYMTGRRAA